MPNSIRVLASDPNEMGDLFARGMTDLAHVMGYNAVRLNVHKSGREVDLQASHRLERRGMRAECKAQAAPVGGSDINKFVGALDAERRSAERLGTEVVGYFISLSGFRETAVEQELQIQPPRMVLLDGDRVVEELVLGRVLVPLAAATSTAAPLIVDDAADGKFHDAQVLLHETGWIWALRYSAGGVVTAVALVHADGYLLDHDLAVSIWTESRPLISDAANVRLLTPARRHISAATPPDDKTTIAAYLAYVEDEFGGITLEGLPADEDVNARRLRLENLFVPLHARRFDRPGRPEGETQDASLDGVTLQASSSPGTDFWSAEEGDVASDFAAGAELTSEGDDLDEEARRLSIGEMLTASRHAALLALPGGGKSTLVKRLAVAYASGDRRLEVDDDLPQRDWLPIVIRCRQLGNLANEPITQVLRDAFSRAELPDQDVLMRLVTDRLRLGRVLLLVDGLDEISSASDRLSFVAQLRTFVGRYPTTQVVVTSRQSGFRVVAAALSPVCDQYEIAELSDSDIERLTVSWHREVVGERAEVLRDASLLAQRIVDTDRVRNLARIPLLLTTLLLVKRWVGDLPRKRTVLYGKAIEVLLATWNVQGHEPLDQDEVLPQLAFVAHQMMTAGTQTADSETLTRWITEARRQMPEELGYARTSVSTLVQRIEERSSLLSLAGHDVVDGQLRPVYEFKHLTFQEYLTALALVRGWYDGRDERTALAELQSRFERPEWREVVPLTVVLLGRQGTNIVQALLQRLQEEMEGLPDDANGDPLVVDSPVKAVDVLHGSLLHCLADEAQVGPTLVEACLEPLVAWRTGSGSLEVLKGTRFEDEVPVKILSRLARGDRFAFTTADNLFRWSDLYEERNPVVLQHVLKDQTETVQRCAAYGAIMHTLFRGTGPEDGDAGNSEGSLITAECFAMLVQHLPEGDAETFCWAWALAWGLNVFDPEPDMKRALLLELEARWIASTKEGLLAALSWAIGCVGAPTALLTQREWTADDCKRVEARFAHTGFRLQDVRVAARVLYFHHGASNRDELLASLTETPEVLTVSGTKAPRLSARWRQSILAFSSVGDEAVARRRPLALRELLSQGETGLQAQVPH